jgi:hypothetical protein
MGPDMYLSARLYTSAYMGKEHNGRLRSLATELGMPPDNAGAGNFNHAEIITCAGYWRKANHIHAWLVQNVQEGVDECQDHDVDRYQLRRLREACVTVLESKEEAVAREVLPTTSGFFFGGTDYDEDYYKDCEHTIRVIDACLACNDAIGFTYRSSW